MNKTMTYPTYLLHLGALCPVWEEIARYKLADKC